MSRIIHIGSSGSIPSVNQLQLGDVAINSYDSQIYYKTYQLTESIERIVTTRGGNIYLVGSISASTYYGDGSNLTGVIAGPSTSASFASTASYVGLVAGPNITIAYEAMNRIAISGSAVASSNTGSFTGSFTGSLLGTASYVKTIDGGFY